MGTKHGMEIVQAYGRKKTALAIALCKRGRGSVVINGSPLTILKPDILRSKVYEVIKILGPVRSIGIDARVFVHGGGQVSRIYAIRQAIAKAFIAFHGKFVDFESKTQIRDCVLAYDRTLLVSDPRRC